MPSEAERFGVAREGGEWRRRGWRLEVGGAPPWLLPRAKRCWNRFRFDSISDFDSSVGPFGREVATVGGGAAAGTEEVSL